MVKPAHVVGAKSRIVGSQYRTRLKSQTSFENCLVATAPIAIVSAIPSADVAESE
jgi:hypothetical protein